MYPPTASHPYLAAELVGFTVGLAVCTLLLGLTLKAAKLPGTPLANTLLALCALLWNVGGLAHAVALLFAHAADSQTLLITSAIQFSGAAAWPIATLAIWRQFAVLPWQKIGARALLLVAWLDAGALVLTLWSAVIFPDTHLPPLVTAKEITSYNACLLLALGAIVLLKGPSTSRAARFSAFTILVGLFGTGLVILIHDTFTLSRALDVALIVVSQQLVLVPVLGAFLLFARFRFADLFMGQSVRVLLTTGTAVLILVLLRAEFISRWVTLTAIQGPAQFSVASVLVSVLLASFARVDRSIGPLLHRWIVRAPDYRLATRQLVEKLGRSRSEDDITAAALDAARRTLEVFDVRSIYLTRLPERLWPPEIRDGECIELDDAHPLRSLLSLWELELLVPVRTRGQVTTVLAISPGQSRRGLVTHEVNYLRMVADHLGSRLDSVRLEHEAVERHNREALLRQQLTEAELRALRAQINPHFLFNSLNTIAELIVTSPGRAEAMTLRLAKVFRHVLAHSSQALTSIRDELDFVRAYLQIEEARFGERLNVEIDLPHELAWDHIPSLILQPLIENALKHGLAPKPGPGHLWISARAQGDHLCLRVEDDGVGPGLEAFTGAEERRISPPAAGQYVTSLGVGLTNTAQRLNTLYQNRARITIEARESGGTSVTILLPRGKAMTAA